MVIYHHRSDLKGHSQTLRKQMTDAEIHLWKRLRGRQINGLRFNRQKIIGPYIVDFFCAKANLVIEIDGGQHYAGLGIQRDQERDGYLRAQGLRVLRFSDRDVFENTEGVLEQIISESSKESD